MKSRRSSGNRILIPLLLMLLLLSAALFISTLFLSIHARQQFREQAQLVQAAATAAATSATVPTTAATVPPETTAETTVPTIPETTAPTEPQMLPEYQALYEENPDFFGWLRIDGTAIDYPVMHTPQDPEKYLRTDFKGKYSFAGTPFLDAGCTGDSDNLLIYAHNMLDGSMFRNLLKYQQKDYWQANPTITFDTLYQKQEFEVLAAFYDRVYLKTETCFKFYQFIDAADEEAFDRAVRQFQEKSLYDTGVTASYGDQLITLVTCAYHTENGRFVVVARKTTEPPV